MLRRFLRSTTISAVAYGLAGVLGLFAVGLIARSYGLAVLGLIVLWIGAVPFTRIFKGACYQVVFVKSFAREVVTSVLRRTCATSGDGRQFVAQRVTGESGRVSRSLSDASLQLAEAT